MDIDIYISVSIHKKPMIGLPKAEWPGGRG